MPYLMRYGTEAYQANRRQRCHRPIRKPDKRRRETVAGSVQQSQNIRPVKIISLGHFLWLLPVS